MDFLLIKPKTYLTLVRIGESTPKRIWENSDIPREEIYRKLEELEEIDFVEKILVTPKVFKAVPLKIVIKELLNKKAEELSQLQTDSEQLLLINDKTDSIDISKNSFKTIIVPKKRAHLEKAKKEMLNLKKSLDCVLSWEKGIGWFNAHFKIFKDLLRLNVKIRWIIERRKNSDLIKQVKELPNHHLFEIKTISRTPGACLGIYDRKIVLLDTSATSAFIQTPLLWSSNPSLIVLAQNYFDTLWNLDNRIYFCSNLMKKS